MTDILETNSIICNSFLNLGFKYSLNNYVYSNSYISSNGSTMFRCVLDVIDVVKARAINLHYVPDLESIFIYDRIKLDKTVIDVTCFNLDSTLLEELNDQIDNTDIQIRSMQLNNYEFLILFYIHCDYITDINLNLDWNTNNTFINDYQLSKTILSETTIAYKLYHRFR